MTRIISGRAGGTVLDVPPAGTRPTSDRARESLFSALESADTVARARVVDLYAGSGALGLEALSRGAASVDLVELNGRAAAIAERNAARVAKALGADAAVRVHRSTVAAFLARAAGPFDLVLLDPPYELGETELAAALTALAPLLAPGGVVVIERASRSPEPALPPGLAVSRSKRYGDTTMWWASATA
ncbi:16S rRNA (guanine(966)-N(2))-methyltransferase RsmD [Microbacterium ulmi]|uniref:16S rRNA (guanine(966)-N(2))-methyltransferase RsmD n=1 Tax=Microbacterium ulmi TaxID=179095 RepID=UPI001478CDC1|nr:16S rRNA (guanine966-N2)-methyltransferase [Microbacterium ulmi]